MSDEKIDDKTDDLKVLIEMMQQPKWRTQLDHIAIDYLSADFIAKRQRSGTKY